MRDVRSAMGILAVLVIAASTLVAVDVTAPSSAQASPAMVTGGTAEAFAQAVMASPSMVTGAEWVTRFDPLASATTAVSIGGFPTAGTTYGVLGSGDTSQFDQRVNPGGPGGPGSSGGAIRGDTDRDVTILRIDFTVPANVNCMVGLDFRFYSYEFPNFVGQQYNDAFIAELDESTWTTSGSAITAPRNFAFDPNDQPITVNAAGASSMSAENASGTYYGGATPLLRARTPITPGPHSLFLSIFDQGDSGVDSFVAIDSIEFGSVLDVATDCRQGATPRFADPKYVALGDGFSAGEGLSPYFDPINRCHRSPRAFPFLIDAPGQPGVGLRDVAARGGGTEWGFQPCSGASTAQLVRNAKWRDPLPQLALVRTRDRKNAFDLPVDRATDLVTLTIGADDVRYRDVLTFCGGIRDCTTERFNGRALEASWASSLPTLSTRLSAALQRIRSQAPSATVIVVGYPLPFPSGATAQDCASLEQITDPRRPQRTLGFTNAEQDLLRTLVGDLNDTIESAVTTTGVGSFVDAEALFAGHEVCGPDGAWIGAPTLRFNARATTFALADRDFHPTACGQRALAALVNEEMNSTVPDITC